MKILRIIGIVILSLLVLLIILKVVGFNLIVHKPSAPGCLHFDTLVFGGCFAKKDIPFQVSFSPRSCFHIGTNTCTGIDIEIENLCNQEVKANNKIYERNNKYIYLNQGEKTGFVFNKGTINNMPFYVLSYITAPLCE